MPGAIVHGSSRVLRFVKRLSALAALTAVVLVACGGRASAASPCPLPHGAKLQARNSKAVVYSVDRGTRGDDEHFTIWRACWRPTGARTRIPPTYEGVDGTTAYVTGVRLAGRFAAVAEGDVDHYGGGQEDIDVYDLARGERRYSARLAAWAPDYGCGYELHLETFVLNRLGFVGWATSRWDWGDPCAAAPTRTETAVRVHDAGGTRVLENAKGAVAQLRITRGQISWLRDGSARSATLR
jgi:hypothetical protein